jgi:hypothetical protein
MSKKRKRGMGKKAQQRQKARAFENALDTGTTNFVSLLAHHDVKVQITRKDARVHKSIEEYFLANPTKTNTTLGEVVEHILASITYTPFNHEIDSQNELSDAPASSPLPLKANETNNLEKSPVESKLLEPSPKATTPPQFGERILLFILTKDERVNIPGDLAEEFAEIAAKHGARFAKVWYYKQVVASAWPMIRKGVRWGVWAWIGEWLRQRI